ncbi:methyl-accepting chemotaxis protein [Lichenifustis flavocetrariae]|uniref:methyl-accepting chemotaxis protein n=1 Tax=Lichenifustis flavocetrariae TaxID=2949735 RepID=UPI0024A75186|nr:methyl-accepting chemotaxis protein [Lichenifustis flavocetrariae]
MAGFAIVTGLIALLMGGIGYGSVFVVGNAMEDALVSSEALQNHTQADSRMDGLRADVLRSLHAVQTGDEDDKKAVTADVKEHIGQLQSAIKDNTALPLEAKVQAAYAKVAPLIEPFIAASQQEIDLAFRDPSAASANYGAYLGGFSALEENMDATRTLLQESMQRERAAAAATASRANISLLSMLVGGLLLIVATAFFIIRAITRLLVGITTSMADLAAGNLNVPVPASDRVDEIGAMAKAVQIFKDNAVRARQVESEQVATHERRALEDEQLRNAAAQNAAKLVVDSIGRGLDRLAAGDLTFRLTETLPPAYEKLRVDLNTATERLQASLSGIEVSTSAIRSGTAEISTAADDLSRRTEQQASSLEETAAALDEITATVKKTAAGATQARAVVSTAKGDAEHSGEVVSQAVKAMSAIEASSQQIGQIIGVIDEIAFQTNLLALNAGVEAARAGEAGRGFAVVASEVRALAQRSAEAAKEIKVLISASAEQVGRGVDLVGETGKALGRIVSQVAEINTIVTDIAASAIEQATGLDQVNTAINQMDQVTQQNAAMVEESTAASKSLAQETEELARLIGQFKVEASTGRGAVRAPVTPASRHVRALKTSGAGGAARKPATQVEQSWEEF